MVANTATNAAFGNNAIGIVDGQTLPAGGDFFLTGPVAAGLFLQTFNPLDLQDSEVFFIGVAFPAGNAAFAESEIGPIPAALSERLGGLLQRAVLRQRRVVRVAARHLPDLLEHREDRGER